MNSLYLHHFRTLVLSFLTIASMLIALLIIAQSAAFLTLTIDQGLSPFVFFGYIFRLVPIQFVLLMPIALIAASAASFGGIRQAGEFTILRAAGIRELSYFSPAYLSGLLLAVIFAIFAFEIAPRAELSLKALTRNSAAQIAENTVINPGEPVQIGETSLFVGAANGNLLQDLSAYTVTGPGEFMFLKAATAEFINSDAGAWLVMQNGTLMRSWGMQPEEAQSFATMTLSLGNQTTAADTPTSRTSYREFTLRQLLAGPTNAQVPEAEVLALASRQARNLPLTEARASLTSPMRIEAMRRIGTMLLLLFTPAWVLFWHLMTAHSRLGGQRRPWVGPLYLMALILLIETGQNALSSVAGQSLFALLFGILIAGPLISLFCLKKRQGNLPNRRPKSAEHQSGIAGSAS